MLEHNSIYTLLPNDIIRYIMSFDDNSHNKKDYKHCMQEMTLQFNNNRICSRILFENKIFNFYCDNNENVQNKPHNFYMSSAIFCFSNFWLYRINKWKDGVLSENLDHLPSKNQNIMMRYQI